MNKSISVQLRIDPETLNRLDSMRFQYLEHLVLSRSEMIRLLINSEWFKEIEDEKIERR